VTNVRSRNETPFPAFIGIDPRPRILKKSLKGRRLRIILARVVSAQRPARLSVLSAPGPCRSQGSLDERWAHVTQDRQGRYLLLSYFVVLCDVTVACQRVRINAGSAVGGRRPSVEYVPLHTVKSEDPIHLQGN
jgi:hypothetical protein